MDDDEGLLGGSIKEDETDEQLEEEEVNKLEEEYGHQKYSSTEVEVFKQRQEIPGFPKGGSPVALVVNKIMNCTVLFDLEEKDWNENVIAKILKFVTCTTQTLLTLYFEDDELRASFEFPTCRTTDIQYFARLHKGIELKPNNFHDALMFGTLDQYPERNALMILERVYSPIITGIRNWPDGPKMSLCQCLHNVLIQLTEFQYDSMGLSGFYVPFEATSIDVKNALKNSYLVARLDRILLEWHSYLTRSISEQQPYFLQSEGHVPMDAFKSALNQYENACGIMEQLQSKPIVHVCNILIAARSPYIQPFLSLFQKVLDSKEKALSNAEFLSILEEPCNKLDSVNHPSEIAILIPDILKCLKFIWATSPYYNNDKQLLILCSSLSNQIVFKLKMLTDFKAAFNLKPRSVIPLLQKNIACCENYKDIYTKAVLLHNRFHPKFWYLEENSIFCKTDTFAQRCKDLLEVSHTLIIFGRIDETKEKNSDLQFFWTRNEQLKKVMKKIEDKFWALFHTIKVHQDKSIDESASIWTTEMKKFREGIEEIEYNTENVLQMAMEDLENIEEGIDILQLFYEYTKRPKLMPSFQACSREIYNLFKKDIVQYRKDLCAERENVYLYMPRYSGRSLVLYLKERRLNHLHSLIKSAYWLKFGKGVDKIEQDYLRLKNTFSQSQEKLQSKWSKIVSDIVVEKRLKRSLFKKTKSGLLYSNVDRKAFKIAKETEIFSHCMLGLHSVGAQLLDLRGDIFLLHNYLVLIATDYNYIITKLSGAEKLLFHQLISKMDDLIADGLGKKYDWASQRAIPYLTECFVYIREYREFTEDYKKANDRIYSVCKLISTVNIYELPEKETFTLHDLEDHLAEVRLQKINHIVDYYNEIFDNLLYIYDGFALTIKQMKLQWIKYITKIDKLIQEALRMCARKSMKSALLSLSIKEGQFSCFSKNIFLKCWANIKLNEVIYDPMFMELVTLAKNFLPDLIIELSFIPRLLEKFNIKLPKKKVPYVSVIALDEECRKLQTSIEKEIYSCYQAVKDYEKIWDPFKCIWGVNRNEFIEQVDAAAPSSAVYREEISKYMSFALNVKSYPKYKTVHILRLDFSEFIQKIIKHCAVWHRRISFSLMNTTAEEIEAIYEFCHVNIKRLLTQPKTLKQVPIALAYQTRLELVLPSIEVTFPEIDRKLELLHTLRDDIPDIMIKRYKEFRDVWDTLQKCRIKSVQIIDKATIIFKEQLNSDYEGFIGDISDLVKKFAEEAPVFPTVTSEEAMNWLADFKKLLEDMVAKDHEFKINLSLVKAEYHRKPELINLDNNLNQLTSVWKVTNDWDKAWESYKYSLFWSVKPEDMEMTAQDIWKKLSAMFRELRDKNWPIVEDSKKRVEAFKRVLPLINDLKNKAMKQRHWDQVKAEMNTDFDEKGDKFTLDLIIGIKMQDYADVIHEISNAATMELNIENTLIKIKEQWSDLNLQLIPHKDKGIFKLVAVDDIFQVLEDNQTAISAMKATRYIQPFLNEANYWEKNLALVLDVLEASLNVQKLYLYLENIFLGEDIRRQLPKEANDFDRISAGWRSITINMQADKNAFKATHYPGLLKTLNAMIVKLEEIQKSLEQYLETKRNLFPRFYFISNDDLLEILGNSKKPELIQPHFKKCFDNIHRINMIVHPHYNRTEGVGMYSGEGEYIPWGKNIILDGPVEQWLNSIEKIMKVCLRDNLRAVKNSLKKFAMQRDKWITQNPGQLCITASQIQWTYDCTKTLLQCRALVAKTPLRKLRKKQNQCLSKYSEAIRGNLPKLDRLKVVAIVTIEIHARDVIETMYKTNCTDVTAFEWQSQLRFYWESALDDCVVKQTNTRFLYGYEYLGNSGRLVITPLTDRCYITLTTALHLYRGGSPKGPAGTGKTETVKDLGKALAYYVIVINCSEGLDYKSMGRMFSGFSQTGAWGCFDEFNRINIEVLSVVAQQILSILSALSQKLVEFVFEGSVIKLVSTCGIFITMNPGYAGRTELPDNLKSMFRPISMMVPDSMLIAEITLFGEGFLDTRMLAKKVFTLFSLAKQQLSKQDHYDFGLRGMVALLRYAGKKRRQHPNLNNEEVVLLAMKDMNIAKLTADDLPLFHGITRDLFPTVTVPAIDYETIYSVLRVEFRNVNLQEISAGFTKVIQLFETKGSRHSVMLVGATGSAKSTTWKMLKATMNSLKKAGTPGFETVQEYLINPKAVNLGELYGEYNLATGEWADGILSVIMRRTCADESKTEKWILFDGPVDAVWIENMNSVMDDNKVLTLINSERITMPEQVSLLFEVGDLAVASPATVSRCGIVYNDYKEFGWRPFFNSWIKQFKEEEYKKEIIGLFDKHVDAILDFKRLHCEETVPVPEICAVISLCRLLQIIGRPQDLAKIYPPDTPDYAYAARIYFFFCVLWSLAASLSEKGRERMDKYIRELESSFPIIETVYEYYVNPKFRGYRHWQDKLPEDWKYNPEIPFCKIFVPSVDSLRYSYLTLQLLSNQFPVLLTGSVGTGKTSCAISVLDNLDPSRYCLLAINMSAQTTSNNIQDTIMSRVEKRTKGVYYPAGGKTMITFMDDFNMPAKEVYGAQPPLELIRQWVDYGFWYNRQDQTIIKVKDMLIMAAMGPPGGGRSMITDRLLSRFSVISVTFPSDSQIRRIFSSMLSQHLSSFPEEIQKLSEPISTATLTLFNSITSKMLPTPAKMHYLFNLRDISRIFQGLLRANTDYMPEKPHLLRLWGHEAFRVFSDRLIDEKDTQWFKDKFAEILADQFAISLSALCEGQEPPVFCDFLNQYNLYAEAKDYDTLRVNMTRQMDEYNSSPGVVRVDLVLFKEAMQHVCRIARVISQPRGHILLVGLGGSGRQSLSRLAAWICQYGTFQIELTRNYRVGEFKEDLKRVYFTSGVKDTPLSFLFCDNQVAEEAFLEILNNILSTGEVTNLYKVDEFEEIKSILFDIVKRAGIVPTHETIYSFLVDRVRTNLHIVLCMSPVGDEFRRRLRQYPSIISCTTIDWFHDWPKQALLEVANSFMQEVDMTATITGEPYVEKPEDAGEPRQIKLRKAVSSVCAIIHDSVAQISKRMLEEMKRHNYVTPSNFLELVATYKQNLNYKREEAAYQANKLRNGLSKLIETRETVEALAVELEEATIQVGLKNEECERFLEALQKQQAEVDEQHKAVAAKRIIIEQEEQECQALADIALADLKEAMPALEAAMKALEALNKKDLTEIKSYGRPPQKVEMVMEAVMVLLQVETSWAEAKRQLGDVNFLNHLKEFDKDHIPDKVLRRIGTFVRNPEFEPEKVGIVSTAAKSLAMWVIAIEKYGKIYRIVAPKKAKVDEAMSSLKEKQNALAEARAHLNKLMKVIDELKRAYDEKLDEKEGLRIKAEELQNKLDRSRKLVENLMGERQRWERTVSSLDILFGQLPGDCLLGTAFVSYMGPFVSQYREKLVETWKEKVDSEEVPNSRSSFNTIDFLAKPTQIRDWNIQGLPSDGFSTENGIIVTRGSRWPLIIDPQAQAWKWIRNMEKSSGLKTVDFGVPNFMKIIESAMEVGEPILLQNVTESLDPSITPILNKAIVQKGTNTFIKLGDRLAPYDTRFKFYITTKLSNPHFPPEISTKTTLVNFAIKEEGLEAQLLGIVVRKERPALEEQKDSLVLNIAAGKKTLIELENELLRLLSESEGPILENIELFNTLDHSRKTAKEVTEQLEVALVTEKEIDAAREGYRICARRASILFFVLTDMSTIDPMYQFSLDSYVDLFESSIAKYKKSNDLAERMKNLNAYHTYAVYKNTCRGLFERHKLLFSFHICMKILQADNLIKHQEYQFLLKGGIVLNRDAQKPKPAFEWITDECWDNITELDKIPGFIGIAKSFDVNQKDWKDWYLQATPEDARLVGEWHENCKDFQKMIILRCLRPDRLSFAITAFLSKYLGKEFTEPPVLDIKAVLEDSVAKTPLIFVLSPGVDPTAALLQLAETSGMAQRFHSLSLGQGQSPIATKLIAEGKTRGFWVFLANCHLSLSWMPALDKIVELLQSDPELHPRFRLWLSSSPHPDFPLSILQSALKMTTEPPKGLKANMKRLYNNLTEERINVCKAESKYKRLLFALCFFHAVLIERKKFQQLGWNVVYSFNDSDFEVSENILAIYLDEYPLTPWDALKYLIAGVCYGGHVTDDWDRRLLLTYINRFFTNDAILKPGFRLSDLYEYYIPEDSDLASYQQFINALPAFDDPQAFGQHANADIMSLINESKSLCETLLSLQGTEGGASSSNVEDEVMNLSTDILSRIPELMDYETTERNIGYNKQPLEVVLLQEMSRYNALLDAIRSSLVDLQKGIKGTVVMSSELEEIFICIYEARIPGPWLRAYPSLKKLGAWTRDLVSRIEFFSKWAAFVKPPILFILAYFTFPTGFLTAVLQTSARRMGISIDILTWDFQPIAKQESEILVGAPEGVFVSGMFLEGAGWDRKTLKLCEPLPMQLVVSLPVILFKPIIPLKKKPKGLYSCPVYYYPQRSGTQGREAFVVAVDLRIVEFTTPDHWIKRGTAILLSLST